MPNSDSNRYYSGRYGKRESFRSHHDYGRPLPSRPRSRNSDYYRPGGPRVSSRSSSRPFTRESPKDTYVPRRGSERDSSSGHSSALDVWERMWVDKDAVRVSGLESVSKQNHELIPRTNQLKYSESGTLATKKTPYKVMYDPEIRKIPEKGNSVVYRFQNERTVKSTDPRKHLKDNYVKYCLNKNSKHCCYKALFLPTYSYDKHSVGERPSCEIVVWNFPDNFNTSIIRANFVKFGRISELEVVSDPISATPLGVCRLKFDDNEGRSVTEAHKSALKAIQECHRKLVLDNHTVRVGLLRKNNNLLEERKSEAIKKFQDAKKQQQKELEKEKELRKRKMEELAKRNEQLKRREQLAAQKVSSNVASVSQSQKQQGDTNGKIFRDLFSESRNSEITVPSPVQVPEHIFKAINGRPFIYIAEKYFPTRRFQARNLKAKLSRHGWVKILAALNNGFFILFNDKQAAIRCYNEENGRRLYDIKTEFRLCLEKDSYEEVHENKDPIEDACRTLVKELKSDLIKDIKEKTIAPFVIGFLNIDNFPEFKKKDTEKEKEKEQDVERKPAEEADESEDVFGMGNFLQQLKLPKFVKNETKKKKKKKSPSKSVNPESGNSRKRQKLSEKRKIVFYSSSEGEDDDEDEKTDTKPESESMSESESDTGVAKPKTDSAAEIELEITQEPQHISESVPDSIPEPSHTDTLTLGSTEATTPAAPVMSEYSDWDDKYKPCTGDFSTVLPDINVSSMDEIGFLELQKVVRDEEDLALIREVFELPQSQELSPQSSTTSTIEYWCWKQKREAAETQETGFSADVPELPNLESLNSVTGSFRSDGYKKIKDELKAEYLPHRRKVHRHEPLNTLKTEDEAPATGGNSSGGSGTNSGSRVNRAYNRRLAADTKQILGTETEILKLNSLNKRRKPVNFARSAIHNWGLYALEPIAANEMIIEYVGDTIRQQVAEQREKQYLKSGIGSSYLFRIDDQTVIDATKKGGIARFINHCCEPSCTAKIIKVDGKKRIVIYALKDIQANEELTYDYKFERETNDEERIVCLCGAPGCKGFLN